MIIVIAYGQIEIRNHWTCLDGIVTSLLAVDSMAKMK